MEITVDLSKLKDVIQIRKKPSKITKKINPNIQQNIQQTYTKTNSVQVGGKRKSVYNRNATNSKGWGKVKPKKIGDRKVIKNKCQGCFLDRKKMKYPYCRKSKNCKPDCKGLLAGYQRSKSVSSRFTNLRKRSLSKKTKDISKKAVKLGKKHKCSWSKTKNVPKKTCSNCKKSGHNKRTCNK